MKRAFFAILTLTLCAAPGCSEAPQDCGADCLEDEPTDSETSDPSVTDPSDSDDEEPAPVPSISVCLTQCDLPADCDLYDGQYTAYDAEHYACTDGGCVWLGCNSDQECSELQPDYKCHPMPFTDFKSCVPSCNLASDCSLAAAGTLYDTDNYECTNGACVFTGCNTDTECQETQGATYVCVDPFNIGQRSCYQGCSISSDCGTPDSGPAYDANNYQCDEGLCIYSGCLNDTECSDTFDGMVCVEQ
jgi:hypothetical protein